MAADKTKTNAAAETREPSLLELKAATFDIRRNIEILQRRLADIVREIQKREQAAKPSE